jgi:putative oxidoreductase
MNVERLSPYVYPLFRIVFGVLFLCHGLQKFGVFGGHTMPLLSRFGVAACIETFGGALIAIGLFTRAAAFIASGEMAFAYFLSHFPRGWLPIQNQGEAAVLFCFAFLYISTRGAGGISVDRR